jgi:hypothetical protein
MKFKEITDHSNEGPGRAGGDNGHGFILPPIIFGKPPIDTSDPNFPKITCGKKGQLDDQGESDSDSFPTDSEEDTAESGYAHTLNRITQAKHNSEPITAILVGEFQGYQDRVALCEFRLDCEGEAPQTLREFFETNWQKLRGISQFLGGEEVPGSLNWTRNKFTDEDLKVQSVRIGRGLKVRIQHRGLQGIPMSEFEATFVTDLSYGLSIAFPAAPHLTDLTLMQYFVTLTSTWDGTTFSKPWPLYLEQKPWRKSETGEIYVEASIAFSGVNPHAKNPRVPYNSAKFPEEVEISIDSDISRTLKFARDNGWGFQLSLATTFDGSNAITITFQSSLEEVEDEITWYAAQFAKHLKADGLVGLPAASRNEIMWKRHCFIGDHAIHVLLEEMGVPTTECDGPPCFLVYAPRATFKFRAESPDIVKRMLTMCYNQEPEVATEHHGKFWALIGTINNGKAPEKFCTKLDQGLTLEVATGYNRDTFVAGQEAQSYRVGVGKFAAQFKPDKPYSATIAIEKGVHGEHGTAIFFEQSSRRCSVTRRFYDLSDEEVFWWVLRDWANFEPKAAKTRRSSGQLYYPSAWSHMVEQHWDFLHAPTVESSLSIPMEKYASAAARLVFDSSLLLDVEAPEKSQRVADSGALSRRCPVQDAQDYWKSPQDQAQEECDTVNNGFAPASDVHNVDTDAGDSVALI